MTPLREFFLLSSVITCFVGLLEGAGISGVALATAAAAMATGSVFTAAAGFFAASGFAAELAADGMVGVACFTFAETGAASVLLLTAAGAGFATAVDFTFLPLLADGFGAGLPPPFATALAATAAGLAAFADLAAGLTGLAAIFFGAADLAALFLAGTADFSAALAPEDVLLAAATVLAVLPVLFAISVHRCG